MLIASSLQSVSIALSDFSLAGTVPFASTNGPGVREINEKKWTLPCEFDIVRILSRLPVNLLNMIHVLKSMADVPDGYISRWGREMKNDGAHKRIYRGSKDRMECGKSLDKPKENKRKS